MSVFEHFNVGAGIQVFIRKMQLLRINTPTKQQILEKCLVKSIKLKITSNFNLNLVWQFYGAVVVF